LRFSRGTAIVVSMVLHARGTGRRRAPVCGSVVTVARIPSADIAEYGLQLDSDGRPLPKFTNDATLNRASGGWVKRTLMTVCGELIGDFEALFLTATKDYCSTEHRVDVAVLTCDPAPLAERLCLKELKMCRPEDFGKAASGASERNRASLDVAGQRKGDDDHDIGKRGNHEGGSMTKPPEGAGGAGGANKVGGAGGAGETGVGSQKQAMALIIGEWCVPLLHR